MNKSLSRIFTLTKRNLKEIIRDPLSLIFTLVLPLFMEILFYLIFHDLTEQFQMKYLAPGIVVFSQAFLTLFTGLLLSTDKNTSFLTRLYVSKAKSYEFIFAYALSVLPITIILSVVTSLFFIGMGILFGSICNEKSIGGVSSIVIVGQSVLSGMWFPVDGLNNGMITFMKVLPFKNATMLIQNMIIGVNDSFNDFILPLLIVLGYTVLAFVVAILVFKNKMKEK